MTMTDPIADMLTRIRNANIAMHDDVRMPSLQGEGGPRRRSSRRRATSRASTWPTTPSAPAASCSIKMKYSPERARTISGLRRVSKPGLRVYCQSTKVPRVLGGLGVAVLSTSQGLHDRPRGAQAQRGRRGPLLRVVI